MQMTQVFYFASAPFYVKDKFSTEMLMESPNGDRNIIDIKVEKYKQIISDNYFGRHAIPGCDTRRAVCCYGVGKVTALKIKMCSSWSFSFSHRWPYSLNSTLLNKQLHLLL